MPFIKFFYRANRHVKLAIILAPLLAIGGYILAGIYLEEQTANDAPRALTLQTPCQLYGDVCELLHRELALNIGIETPSGAQPLFYLRSSTPLQGGLLAIDEAPPQALQSRGSPDRWMLPLNANALTGQRLRLVVSNGKHHYFAEIPLH